MGSSLTEQSSRPNTDSIHHWVEGRAAQSPHAIAITCADQSLSYGELNRRANLLAHRLIQLGVGPDHLVGICLERSPEMVIGILGILKAGGAYVPIDADNPAARTQFILADAELRIVVSNADVQRRFDAGSATVVSMDAIDWSAQQHATNPDARARPDDLAYVIYTSGSTGKPKGTLVTHRNVTRLFRTTERWFDFGPRDVWTVFHSFAFDFSVWELWGALLYGGRAVIVSGTTARSPESFRDLLRREGVTVLCQTPSAFYPLIDAVCATSGIVPLALRFVIFGGEALDFTRLQPWFERAGCRAQLINMYGITEITVHASYHPIDPDALTAASVIGVPLPDTQIHLLDERGVAVPAGEIGEICIGGPGVALGYLNRPDLTAARFVADPFSHERDARLYKSGDRARLRPDGTLEFCGRADSQVKLRGYRIELGEIEATLNRQNGVAQSVVLLKQAQSGDKELVAWFTSSSAESPAPATLRTSLSETLPAYMVPAAFVGVTSWPLTQNGKLDRDALPAPRREHRLDTDIAAPRTPTESLVTRVWAECLGVAEVGTFDDCFALGAHSLMAGRVCARLRRELRVPLSLSDVLAARTPASLAARIDAMRTAAVDADADAVVPRARGSTAPTSFAQDPVLFFEELAPGNLAYNNQVTIRLNGTLNVAILQRALSEIVRRHEALRTTFRRADDGNWEQVVHDPWPVRVPIISDSEHVVATLYEHRFDPATLPLVVWTLVQKSPHEHVLVHVEHHLIHDGWSFGVFMQELTALYTAYHEGRPSPLEELSVQHADFAIWQRQRLQGPRLTALQEHWRANLRSLPAPLQLPADKSRPSLQTFRGAEVQRVLSPELGGALRSFARDSGCSLFAIMLAAFAALLRRYSGEDDLIIGAGFANRDRSELEPVIGMIVNMLPLRIDTSGDPEFVELARRVRTVVHDAMAFQETPFELIVRGLDLPRDASSNPVCQVAFSFHDSVVPNVKWPNVSGEVSYPHNGSAKLDMNIIVIPHAEQQADAAGGERDNRITIKWDGNTDVFDLATIERMVQRYVSVLETVVGNTTVQVSRAIGLDREDQRLLGVLGGARTDYPRDRGIPDLFDEQAALRPSATALVFGDKELSYAELAARSNRLAHYLRSCGVAPEVRVGVCVERSIDMVVAILGILKAGGAYVPLDPEYPKSRLEFMVSDSAVPVIVTHSHLLDALPQYAGRTICVDRERTAINAQSDRAPDAYGQPAALAYVIYTSGSTGQPKGVCIEHRSVVRLVRNTNYADFGPDDTFLQSAPVSFDASTLELWGSLLNGARLAILGPGVSTPDALSDAIRRHRVSVVWLTAALFNHMVDFDIDALTQVRRILAGGEALSVSHARRMLAALREGHQLINGYGPTENTTFTCCHVMSNASEVGRSVPIGTPISNTQVFVLDEHMQPVPEGVPGELFIGGDGLARGYLNRPELTAEKFVEVEGRRLYRSGDRVRVLRDGALEFLGRMDDQVKVRGYRIEPGEIQAILNAHPAVRQSHVLARTVDANDKRLVAYIVVNAGASVTASAVRQFLKERLPSYMVPSDVLMIDQLPLTPVGKVDRAALETLALSGTEDPDAVVLPRTTIEEQITEIWAHHLGHSDFGVESDFFDVGGHSLIAAAMIAELRTRFTVPLPLAMLFQKPTIAQLAHEIDHAANDSAPDHIIAVQPNGPKPPVFAMLGVGGHYRAYRALSRGLGSDQPFYSFEMPGADGDHVSLDRMDAIVAELRDEVTAIHPNRPCVLMGACAGAMVVYELARTLAQAGRPVQQVIMVDPPPTGAQRARRLSQYSLWRRLLVARFVVGRLRLYARTFFRLNGPQRARFIRDKLALARYIVAKREMTRDSGRELQRQQAMEAASAALTRYQPGRYTGSVQLMLGERFSPQRARQLSAAWRTLCTGSFAVARVPGKDTGQMLRAPNIEVLIAGVKSALAK